MKLFIIISCLVFSMSIKAQKLPTIYLIGDSTMANKQNPEVNPEFGWGQVLPHYFDSRISIKNYAVNGRSSKSFIEEGRWNEVIKQVKEGDFVFIQFGHNDQKIEDPSRYTNPSTTYKNNIIRFVKETKAKNAIPILLTSIARRNFNDKGVLVDTHGLYPLVVTFIANQLDVVFIDAYSLSENIELQYGPENSKLLHLHFKENENSYFPKGKVDNTHLSFLGANSIAKAIVNELKTLNIGLSPYIKLDDEK